MIKKANGIEYNSRKLRKEGMTIVLLRENKRNLLRVSLMLAGVLPDDIEVSLIVITFIVELQREHTLNKVK